MLQEVRKLGVQGEMADSVYVDQIKEAEVSDRITKEGREKNKVIK